MDHGTLQMGYGVGWDNNVIALAFSCISTHTSCYAVVLSHAHPHIRHGVGWGGIITSLHLRSHAHPHIRHATLWCCLMHFDAICHGLHVSLELNTTLAESSWKIGEESIALERWTKKALIFQKLVC